MANLVIDVGNTFIKTGVFSNDEMLYTGYYKTLEKQTINELLNRYQVSQAIISTVNSDDDDWISDLAGKVRLTHFERGMGGNINNRYLTPGTLGLDRLAAIMGANYLYPGKNNLVIDGGTCITYDWVDADSNYFGGSISPGLSMRYKALNDYTAALPLLNPDAEFTRDSGNDTASAIRSGVQNGIKHELTGFINSYKKKGGEMNILLAGGDSIFFDTLLKNSIFAPYIKIEPWLVLKGLNVALNNNND